MKKFIRWLKDSWDEAVIYVATLAAVIVAPYLGSAAAGTSFNIGLKWWTLVVGAVIALFIVARNEGKGVDPADDAKTARGKREAKRRNIGARLAVCMGNAFVWPNVIGVAANVISNLTGS